MMEPIHKIQLQEPYQPRPIRFLELWTPAGWRIKVYGIAYRRQLPRPELVEAAKQVTRTHLDDLQTDDAHYGVGYLGIHDGRGANFVFFDYWADENELHHHVYVSPSDDPRQLTYTTPTGLSACVWDLSLQCFERQAWVDTVLANEDAPDVEAYLARRMDGEV